MANEQLYPDIGRRLEAIRKAFSQLSQAAWAGKHGFQSTQYNNWERGTRRIPVDEAQRLCEVYGLTLDFVYRGRRDGLSETALKCLAEHLPI
jgi:transcriptional regulator with XRE-family HTH domain